MPRVSPDTIRKLQDFLDSLPEDLNRKCAYCNETLTHLCKTAEAKTGAGTATVTREIANRINDGAAPGDRVSGRGLEMRVHRQEGDIVTNRDNNPAPEPEAERTNQQFRTSFSGENEWYTPAKYIESARKVLGEIDLDPASSEHAQKTVLAQKYFTKETDGLSQKWAGKIWLNPPYSQPLIYQFIEKLITECNQKNIASAIALTHNYTDTAWFHLAESEASLICFTRGRIRFEDAAGNLAAPTQGSAFFYFGDNLYLFREVFGQYGFIR